MLLSFRTWELNWSRRFLQIDAQRIRLLRPGSDRSALRPDAVGVARLHRGRPCGWVAFGGLCERDRLPAPAAPHEGGAGHEGGADRAAPRRPARGARRARAPARAGLEG